MNETNLTQHGRSTDVNAFRYSLSKGYKDILNEKRWNLLRTTSFYGNSSCVRILINIIMVYVRVALIIKALKYELEN